MATPARRSRTERVTVDRFDKFTDRARKVLVLAQDEAQRFDHNYVGTEHLLLGLVREKEGVAARVLASLGADLGKIRTAVEFIIGRGDQPVVGEVGLTPRAKRVIELAIDEARRLGHNYIGTEHLLLGLVREGEGIAAGVLESMGVNLDRTRHEVIAILSAVGAIGHPNPPAEAPPPGRQYARFDDWHPAARAVLVDAGAIARAQAGAKLATDHLLLGLVAAPDAPAVAVLALLGVERAEVQEAVGKVQLDADPATVTSVVAGLTLDARMALGLAEGEASRTDAAVVSAGHLLVSLALMPTTAAGQALTALGVTTARLREVIGGLPGHDVVIENTPGTDFPPDDAAGQSPAS
jgi:ATP-dependent Clp protease ATP-binding subunit ClpA